MGHGEFHCLSAHLRLVLAFSECRPLACRLSRLCHRCLVKRFVLWRGTGIEAAAVWPSECFSHFRSVRKCKSFRSSAYAAVAQLVPDPTSSHGFNPRPSSLTGEPFWLALQSGAHAGFNPRPSSLTGEPRQLCFTYPCVDRFNPRPSSLTGEPRLCKAAGIRWYCFNPRPSSLTGEPLLLYGSASATWVSIHARHR